MTAATLLGEVGRFVAEHELGWWLAGAGVVALYLAYRAVRLVGRLIALGVAALTFLASGPVSERVPGPPLPDLGRTSAAHEVDPPTGGFRAVVTHVADGDTLRARVTDAGATAVRAGEELELRLLRVDAPELARDGRPADCLADAATTALTQLVPRGAEVEGVHDVERHDRYDRDLVHLWTADGTWVNGALLAGGWAQVVTFPPNTAYDDEVRAAEAGARRARRGRWDPGAC